MDTNGKTFIECRTNQDSGVLANQFEAYNLQGEKAIVARNANERACELRKSLRTLLRNKLRELTVLLFSCCSLILSCIHTGETTGDENATLQWLDHYAALVQKHHVELVGWPLGSELSPDKLTLRSLEAAIELVECGHCFWRKLSVTEYEERVKHFRESGRLPAAKKRAQRSDKGTSRKHKNRRTEQTGGFTVPSVEYINDSDDNSD